MLTLHLYPDEWWGCDAPVAARAGVEVGAAVAALPLGLAGVLLAEGDTAATWTAVNLTVAGAAVTALSLIREDRRALAWLGGALSGPGQLGSGYGTSVSASPSPTRCRPPWCCSSSACCTFAATRTRAR